MHFHRGLFTPFHISKSSWHKQHSQSARFSLILHLNRSLNEHKKETHSLGRARANENNTLELTIAYRDCVRATGVCLPVWKGSRKYTHLGGRRGAICTASFDAHTRPFVHMNFWYAHLVSRAIFIMSCWLCFAQSLLYITVTGGETMAHSYLNYLVECNSFVCLVIR